MQLGIGAVLAAAFLLLFAIPNWISSPSNVRNIVLSPLFWPGIVASLTGLVGVGMLLSSWRKPKSARAPSDVDDRGAAVLRLIGAAIMMGATMVLMSRIGLVWTSMLVFMAAAALVKTSHPRTALIAAVGVPLILYIFFAHVAGVAIPQGDYVRLP